jgi:hypothetical protein
MTIATAEPTTDLRVLREELVELRRTHPRRSSVVAEAFGRLFRASCAAGLPLDGLRKHTGDEIERFFAQTIPGLDGHVYWDGARYGFARNDGKLRTPRRWWWAHVNGVEPGQYEDIVSTCGEQNCINPEHCEQGRGLRRERVGREAMLGSVRVAALRLGRAPNSMEWNTLGLNPTRKTLVQRFGSWENVIREAGVEYGHIPGRKASPRLCIEALRFARKQLGHWPSYREFLRVAPLLRAEGLPSASVTIRKHLGGWAEALYKAGKR